MQKQLEELNKACGTAETAGMALLKKSHVKETTYTNASGTTITRKEHEDSRRKAVKASNKALGLTGKSYSGATSDQHKQAAKAHQKAAEALKQHKNTTGGSDWSDIDQDIHYHTRQAEDHKRRV